MAVTERTLTSWLVENAGVDASELGPTTPLFSSARVDSFDMVDLVAWIEAEGGVQFGPMDIDLANLDTIARILAFVERQKA